MTADNKQVAPPLRYAQLRGTPAQDVAGAGSVRGSIEEWSRVEREEAPASQLWNVMRHACGGSWGVKICTRKGVPEIRGADG